MNLNERLGALFIAIDHVAIAVPNLEEAIAQYSKILQIEVCHRERVDEQGVEEALIKLGESYVQLLQPISEQSPVAKFLAKRGPGLHHIGCRVTNVDAAIAHLLNSGARMIDNVSRRGSRNTKIAFVHPSAMGGVLVEL